MELTLEPELYAPSLDNNGIFVDNIPQIRHGIRCPCSSREYTTKQNFVVHTKTKTHQKWLESVNNNRENLFVENVRLNELVKNQQLIIAKLENEVKTKSFAIEVLAKMLSDAQNPNTTTCDLLDL